MLPEGLQFLKLGWWAVHAIAISLVFTWGYRKGRQAERRDRRDDEKRAGK
ncbi:MAG TPA: hypothetical protein VMJ70_16165 [Candidatus Sulfotelmatobacter sp.]|nr:hypothetical protein [Candidatus Sulfotelmatobacter sp.]